ncbi:carotenoid ester lipase precursor [Mycena pura]|uniref:Carboxylic ester hydrolase n=1 Tax=Mycena pura TaxID=153505 RepID=A0AAD6V7Y0_9AGAR|nr:carotenoid ester lipase precursor [Mycena pura]
MYSLLKSGLFVLVLQTRTVICALAAPTITLDAGTFTGTVGSANTQSFLGIPFAQPPVADLRLRLPVANTPYTGSHDATAFGLACPQQAVKLPILTGVVQEVVDDITNSIFAILFPDSEDCLTLNVVKPAIATPTSNLPVVMWIFGGGFEVGSPNMERSLAIGEPVIFVSMNYRLSAFGFLASKEVREAGVGNLGLQDQREAMRWVQKYISNFGGDPSKVTIWGESSGAVSVAMHMLANDGDTEGLFRAAFMQSGSPVPVGPLENGQLFYDQIVQQVGCAGSADTLECLRTVPFDSLKAAQDATPFILSFESLRIAWPPRADGTFLSDNPQRLVQQGKVANIPFISGDCDDEGTLFSFSTTNLTTDAEFLGYIQTIWVPGISTAQLNTLNKLYPSDILDGSPFDTGILNALTPQFKRIAAFQGDGVFQAPRRFFQQSQSGKQNQWAFPSFTLRIVSKRGKAVPLLGSFHTSDLVNVFGDGELTDFLVNFATTLNPNGPTVPHWPAYTTATPNMMTFLDALIPTVITQDTYRASAIQFLTNLTLEFPV